VPLEQEDFDRLGRDIPLLVDLMPSGRFLMEDFCYAGGVPAVFKALGPHLRGDAVTVSGLTQAQIADMARCDNPEVIRTMEAPVAPSSGLWVLRGNLSPGGAVMKPSAASPELLVHKGRAVVFESIEDYKARIDLPDLDVDETCVLVLKGCGPKGYPGMPEVGNMALPAKLLAKGVRDMVRISDARMSGTAFGTVILHVNPEADAGGPLALVQDGDLIALDGPARTLTLQVTEAELARRAADPALARPASPYVRGWAKLYVDTVLQADRGCDQDFLVGSSGDVVSRESH
jgi:dihydroxy-acid dehydratase